MAMSEVIWKTDVQTDGKTKTHIVVSCYRAVRQGITNPPTMETPPIATLRLPVDLAKELILQLQHSVNGIAPEDALTRAEASGEADFGALFG